MAKRVSVVLAADDSIEFILKQVELLADGKKSHEKAAYRALLNLTQRWAEPTDLYVDEDLAMAEKIGQDLADLQRHVADIQHAYMKALFGETAG